MEVLVLWGIINMLMVYTDYKQSVRERKQYET